MTLYDTWRFVLDSPGSARPTLEKVRANIFTDAEMRAIAGGQATEKFSADEALDMQEHLERIGVTSGSGLHYCILRRPA